MSNTSAQDLVSSIPASSVLRTPAEQAARAAWLIRMLVQVSMALSYMLRAVVRRQAGDEAAADANLRKALAWMDRIIEELKAQRQADLARAAKLPRAAPGDAAANDAMANNAAANDAIAAGEVAAGEAMERAIVRALGGAAGRDGAALARTVSMRPAPDAPRMPRCGLSHDPPGLGSRRWGLRPRLRLFISLLYRNELSC